MTAAGREPVLCAPGLRSHPTSWDEITAARPDVVVVAPCGYDCAGAATQAATISGHLPVDAQLWAVDANAYIVRPGPRLVDGVELLASVLHPSLFGPPPPERATRLR